MERPLVLQVLAKRMNQACWKHCGRQFDSLIGEVSRMEHTMLCSISLEIRNLQTLFFYLAWNASAGNFHSCSSIRNRPACTAGSVLVSSLASSSVAVLKT